MYLIENTLTGSLEFYVNNGFKSIRYLNTFCKPYAPPQKKNKQQM